MGKRYKILEGALDLLRTSDEGANPKAPSGTPLEAYQQWKSGERNITYDRATDSLPQELLVVAINPFGESFDVGSKYIVPISKRANEANTINPIKAAANIIATLPDGVNNVKGFIPAKAVISVPDPSKDSANATSQLTKRKYNKKGYRSYTIPYGAKDAGSKEKDVRNDMLDALPDGSNYSISFTSERL